MKFLINIIKDHINFRRKILTNNTGVSSKSWVMLEGMSLAKVVVYWYLGVLTVEMFTDYVLRSDWKTFAAVITSLTLFIGASAYGKIKGEESYYGAFNSDDAPPDTSLNKEDGVV